MQRRNHPRRNDRRKSHSSGKMDKIDRILIDVQKKLRDSIEPYTLENLSGFERKRIHSFFDNREEFETKSYRRNGKIVLKVIPVGNLQRFAREKASEVLATGEPYQFPPLSGYERYLIHNWLHDFEGVETVSDGEGENRRLEIRPVRFGRSLKRIIKKIKII